MFSLMGFLCRLCKCVGRGERPSERAPESAQEPRAPDDLTAIRGLGEASRDKLRAAGITTYDQMARTSADSLRAIVGKGAKVEDWIAQAEALAGGA